MNVMEADETWRDCAYNAQTFTVESRPPVARYLSMYRSRSTGLVCPFEMSEESCIVVRL